jgi:hypothetical protein
VAPTDDDLTRMFEAREERLKKHHNEEAAEWEERVTKLQGKSIDIKIHFLVFIHDRINTFVSI